MGGKVGVRDSHTRYNLLYCIYTCMYSIYCVTDVDVDRNKVVQKFVNFGVFPKFVESN
jgi:hypothetical protein